LTDYPVYGRLDGPVVVIGFGSIGRGTVPLLLRHFELDPANVVVVSPDVENDVIADKLGVQKITVGLSRDNYRDILIPLLTSSVGQAFCVNLSVDTSSVDLMEFAKELDAFYLDTVVEPWPGLYTDRNLSISARSKAERAAQPGWAAFAARIAFRTSSRVPSATVPITSPVAGL